MYKAIKEIGGYNVGEEVPTEKALVWLEMYDVPHVKKIDDKIKEVVKEEKIEENYTPDDLFFKELTKIKGIGNSTAEDIVTWGTKEKLIEEIKKGGDLPFRDDVEKKLKLKYG